MSRSIPINPQATVAFAQVLSPSDRLLILGASGWFGRTALAAVGGVTGNLLLVGSFAREIEVSGRVYNVQGWDIRAVEAFEPTVVFDFAFLTRDLLETLGEVEYLRRNRSLSARLFEVASIPSVRRLLSVSSGASLKPQMDGKPLAKDPYGQQKRATELGLREIAAKGVVEVTVARAWSVSGGFVQKPFNYALSDFVISGLKHGVIAIRADHLVWRRYCTVEDLLAVALLDSLGQSFYELDSGGTLIELAGLANVVSEEAGGLRVEVQHSNRSNKPADTYYSSGEAWNAALKRTGYKALTLREQIRNVAEGLAEI
jgi:nucleoside-diphosphate-sugar epimerase